MIPLPRQAKAKVETKILWNWIDLFELSTLDLNDALHRKQQVEDERSPQIVFQELMKSLCPVTSRKGKLDLSADTRELPSKSLKNRLIQGAFGVVRHWHIAHRSGANNL